MFEDVSVHTINNNILRVDKNDWNVDLSIVNTDVNLNLEIDSGAKCNVMSCDVLLSLGVGYEIKPSKLRINGVHGNSEKSQGMVVFLCRYKSVMRNVQFEVLNNVNRIAILGIED